MANKRPAKKVLLKSTSELLNRVLRAIPAEVRAAKRNAKQIKKIEDRFIPLVKEILKKQA